MPHIRIDDEIYDYLKRHSNGGSMSDTIRRMLGIGKSRRQTVRKQVDRDSIAPRETYTWTILRAFEDEIALSRKDLQGAVEDSFKRWKLLDIYPEDDAEMRHGQSRWKTRFGAALAHLKNHGCIESAKEYEKNHEGGEYRITRSGRDILRDYKLWVDDNQCFIERSDDPQHRPLEAGDLPDGLIGRQKQGKEGGTG